MMVDTERGDRTRIPKVTPWVSRLYGIITGKPQRIGESA